ncbi:MAG: type II toxin-antitoxin system VapC family toxin [Actinobacteria bacterium]|nr:type II toxin-antitoxin system VapC family toxin [Actinomycetota bacterium]
MRNGDSGKSRSTVPSAVIDASAVASLLLGRAEAAAVGAALLEHDVVAPGVFDAEVLSAVRRAWLNGELEEPDAADAVHRLVTMPVERVPDVALLYDAWLLRHNVSAADALYVALARRLRCPLVTLDRRLAAAPDLGITVIVPG